MAQDTRSCRETKWKRRSLSQPLTKEQYQSYLQGLTVSDLREEAIKVGLIPTRNLERLRKQLITEFDKYTMAYNHVSSKKEDNLTKEQEQTLLNILRAVK